MVELPQGSYKHSSYVNIPSIQILPFVGYIASQHSPPMCRT